MPQRILQTVTRTGCHGLLALLFVSGSALAGDILVRLDGKQATGAVHLALVFADRAQWQEPPLRLIQGEESVLRLRNLPPGRFAIQLFQDRNGNGRLDLSPRGIPLEPVGFSNNPPLLNGKPQPLACLFVHGTTDSQLTVRLHAPRAR
jgi:uncharacterized protein (DUF2141 family)